MQPVVSAAIRLVHKSMTSDLADSTLTMADGDELKYISGPHNCQGTLTPSGLFKRVAGIWEPDQTLDPTALLDGIHYTICYTIGWNQLSFPLS